MEIYYSPMAYFVCNRASVFISEKYIKHILTANCDCIYAYYLYLLASVDTNPSDLNIFEFAVEDTSIRHSNLSHFLTMNTNQMPFCTMFYNYC